MAPEQMLPLSIISARQIRDVHFHAPAFWAQVIEFLSHLQHKCALYHRPFQGRNVALSLAQPGWDPFSSGDDGSLHELCYWHNQSFKWVPGDFCLPQLPCIFSDGFLKINNRKFLKSRNTQRWQHCQDETNVTGTESRMEGARGREHRGLIV